MLATPTTQVPIPQQQDPLEALIRSTAVSIPITFSTQPSSPNATSSCSQEAAAPSSLSFSPCSSSSPCQQQHQQQQHHYYHTEQPSFDWSDFPILGESSFSHHTNDVSYHRPQDFQVQQHYHRVQDEDEDDDEDDDDDYVCNHYVTVDSDDDDQDDDEVMSYSPEDAQQGIKMLSTAFASLDSSRNAAPTSSPQEGQAQPPTRPGTLTLLARTVSVETATAKDDAEENNNIKKKNSTATCHSNGTNNIGSSGSKRKKKKSVSFSNILEIRTHPVILSDHPCCQGGMAMECDWECDSIELIDLDIALQHQQRQQSAAAAAAWQQQQQQHEEQARQHQQQQAARRQQQQQQQQRRRRRPSELRLSYAERRRRLCESMGVTGPELLQKEFELLCGHMYDLAPTQRPPSNNSSNNTSGSPSVPTLHHTPSVRRALMSATCNRDFYY